MAVAARYWRVSFRASSDPYGSFNLGFESMRLYKADGTEAVAAAVTMSANAADEDGVAFPRSNLTDGAANTFWVLRLPFDAANMRTVTFDLGIGVAELIDNVRLQTSPGPWPRPAVSGTHFDFFIDSSTDGVTYHRQALHYRPIRADNALTRIAATVSSTLYPIPSRADVGGTGGIYGIVSEDGIALPNRPVILYERESFAKVAWITTDENGGYGFNGLNVAREFLVLSYDPSGPPFKNALVWDHIKPINTLSNAAPQSAFWARRARDPALGGVLAVTNYIDGETANFVGMGTLGSAGEMYVGDGGDFAPITAVGGAIKFLKSGRTPSNTSSGIVVAPGTGTFNGVNGAGQTANYSALTFEYLFVAPTNAESPMIIVWQGTRDSDDSPMAFFAPAPGRSGWGAGPTLEITPAGVINVRIPLGARNRSTVRATATITPGTMHHVVVTYAEGDKIKLFVDGVLAQTTSITGSGRLWGHLGVAISDNSPLATESWDNPGEQFVEAALRRLTACMVAGSGRHVNNALVNGAVGDRSIARGPGFGGAIGLVALYGRTMPDVDVGQLYDSFANWDTHVVPVSLPGYMGEVEADNPALYIRMNDLSAPSKAVSILGKKDFYGAYEGTPTFGETGFVAGTTATAVGAGAVSLVGPTLNTAFSVEFFMRQTSASGTQYLFSTNKSGTSSNPYGAYLAVVAGKLILTVVDISDTATAVAFNNAPLAAATDYHVVVSYDPWTTMASCLYVNGVLVAQQSAPALPRPSADLLAIGGLVAYNRAVSNRFQGVMGEFALYNYALSAERVQAHYDARLA